MSLDPVTLGPFLVERKLGGGAFKTVYAAVNTATGRNPYPERVALCLPRAQDEEARRLLENEFRIVKALAHPGIAAAYGLEESEGASYMVMELVDGETLSDLVRKRGPLPLEEVLPIMKQAGAALDFAHERLAIHRDIKPANIMRGNDGAVKVLDFGLARLMAHSQYHATTRTGSIAYMAPEQFAGATGLVSDFWGLGITCFELLTNAHPFPARDEATLMHRILHEPADLVPLEGPEFDPRLAGVLRKMLDKEPERRYQRAAEFVADLEAVARHGAAVSQQEGRLEALFRAHFPLVFIQSAEEDRVLAALSRVRAAMSAKEEYGLYLWSETRGLHDLAGRSAGPRTAGDPVVALQHVAQSKARGIFVFLDLHRHFTPVTIRLLRDAVSAVKRQPKNLVVLSPVLKLPAELEGEATLFFFDLPDAEALKAVVDEAVAESGGDPGMNGDWRDNMAAALLGMSAREAERAVRRALCSSGASPEDCLGEVLREKRQAVRKSGVLEYCAPGLRGSDVGGLEALKGWFRERRKAFSAEGARFGLPRPKGVVLAGVPGCGKSLSAKALAGDWGVPLLRLDMGRIHGSLLGQSEARLRQALGVAECVSPCVLWIDELEKAFAGLGGARDGGVTMRIFGSFLTWLSANRPPVFVAATANDVTGLPPEFTRAGRFDKVFFVDLPGPVEREAILGIHLRKRKRDPAKFDLRALAAAAEGYSGAEIEEAVVNALYRAFEEAEREVTTADVSAGLREIVPLSESRADDLMRMRLWARTSATAAS